MKLILCCTAAFWEMHRVSWGNHTTLLTPGVLTTRNMCLGFTLWCLTHTSISQSWSDPILDQNKKEKKKKKIFSTSSKRKCEKVNSYHCPWGEKHQRGLRGQNFSQSSGLQSLQSQARTDPFLSQELSGCPQDQCRVGSSPHIGCTRSVLQPVRVKLTMNFP